MSPIYHRLFGKGQKGYKERMCEHQETVALSVLAKSPTEAMQCAHGGSFSSQIDAWPHKIITWAMNCCKKKRSIGMISDTQGPSRRTRLLDEDLSCNYKLPGCERRQNERTQSCNASIFKASGFSSRRVSTLEYFTSTCTQYVRSLIDILS